MSESIEQLTEQRNDVLNQIDKIEYEKNHFLNLIEKTEDAYRMNVDMYERIISGSDSHQTISMFEEKLSKTKRRLQTIEEEHLEVINEFKRKNKELEEELVRIDSEIESAE